MSAAPILLVEDSPEDAELTVHALQDFRLGNRLVVVRDGVEALEFLRCTGSFAGRVPDKPVVVLLDLKLPRIGGLEVLRQMRADPALADVPVVVMTSSREAPDIQRAYALGANGYVVKPISFGEFAEATRRLGAYWILTNVPPTHGG